MSGVAAAFLDRDGVINQLVPDPASGRLESPPRVQEVQLIPGATAALRRMADAGLLLVGVSNQPAAAKGKVTLTELQAVHARVVALVAEDGVSFDAFRLCFHHPEGTVPALTGECECRKPAPGMLLDAAAELGIDPARSWMIGDTDSDVRAGQAAGCRTVLIAHPGSAHKRGAAVQPDTVVEDLAAAVSFILDPERVH